MDGKAQTGVDLLLTYGWALLMIATIIGLMMFVTGRPLPEAKFSVDGAGKIILKSGIASQGTATAVLQNTTGGQILVMGIEETGNIAIGSCSMESGGLTGKNLLVGAGQAILLECPYTGNAQGTITINYKNSGGESQKAIVSIWN